MKTLITGNPSSGTTFTVALLTRLGLDTGYTGADIEGNYAGLEIMAGSKQKRRDRRRSWDQGVDVTPEVIKHPFDQKENYPKLLTWADQFNWEVGRVILLMRSVDQIHRSNYSIERHDRQLSLFLLVAAEREWPVNLLAFPKAALDVEYCYRALQPLSGAYEQFKQVWLEHAEPERIHNGY